ncbi:FkbM family methyltransferase [Aliisedimentitalea scapharcae]|uniref:FkbM family methyltransferase n=1 Tax=Aliisedimentitalea scapharcae TaxID=1524259 RepID=A0ABZ2XSC7_9RHOB
MPDTSTKTPTFRDKSYIESRGIRFPKDGVFITGRIRGSLRSGEYEAKEAAAVLKAVQDGDTVMELGAGVGFISSLVAIHKNVKAVHAFEANPQLIPYIKSVYAENNITNAHIHNAILGPEKGTATFFVRQNFLSSSLTREDADGVIAEETIEIRETRATSQEIRPDVLICDIEGAEQFVIPDMDLSSVRVAILELHPQWIGSKGVAAVFQTMMAAGLVYFPKWSHAKVVVFRRDW